MTKIEAHGPQRVRRSASLVLSVLFLFAAIPATGETIESTTNGGAWTVPATWVGGVAPGPDDDVVLHGPVRMFSHESCANLEVTSTGSLSNARSAPYTLQVGQLAEGAVTNHGLITDASGPLRLRLAGDLTNHGIWTNSETTLDNTADQHLFQAPGATFESNLLRNPNRPGALYIDTPFSIVGNLDQDGGEVILGPDCPLTLQAGAISGEIFCGGNQVHFDSGSYLERCTLDGGILIGQAGVSHGVTFRNGVTVMGGLSNVASLGSSHLLVDGDLINHGSVFNDTYGFTMEISGDLECHGEMTNSYIAFGGIQDHHLRMGLEGDIATFVLLPEFGAGVLIAETDVRVSGEVNLGAGGTMILEPGAFVNLTGGSIAGGTLLAGGNAIQMSDTGALGLTQIDSATLHGTAQVSDGTTFTNGLQVWGVLRNSQFSSAVVFVDGALINDGRIEDYTAFQLLFLELRGDVINRGTWTSARVELNGVDDQVVDVGGGIDVPEFVLDAGIESESYQWYRDEVAIPNATDRELLFVTVGEADSGSYHCEGGSGEVSRTILIGEDVVTSAPDPQFDPSVDRLTTVSWLAPVRPNPWVGGSGFRTVEIEYVLAKAGPVRLGVFDTGGREVHRLLSASLPAGRHRVPWTPSSLASGVYFIRLEAPDGVTDRKVAVLE